MVAKVPVSQVTQLRATAVAATHVTLSWKAPAKGTPPIAYTIYFKKKGATQWSVGATFKTTTAEVLKLLPKTEYEFECAAHNW